jgi:4-hydroxy-2-oxoheptanedioate aldolase
MTNKLKQIWAEGRAAINAWLAIPSGFSAEVVARSGFDTVTVDLQHGVQDYLSMVACFQAMKGEPVTPMVRVPWNEPGIIGKVLDAGAYGVICPMINTAGVYLGPSDLGFSHGLVPKLDRDEPEMLAIYDRVIAAAERRGLRAGLHCGGAPYAARAIGMGFRLVTILNDSGLLALAARAAVAQVRRESNGVA